jgi:Uma2 family endonuclease
MTVLADHSATGWTLADLLERFGPIPAGRVRSEPAPGSATEQDVVDIHDREERLFELIDGTLVEKTVGVRESFLAVLIASLLRDFASRGDLGMVLGADGMARLAEGQVRIPDVSFVTWERLPGRSVPDDAILGLAPDLAVEVLSPGNTPKEMARKLHDYFQAGVRLVWFVSPATRTIEVFTAPDHSLLLDEGQVLDGGAVLPGLAIPVRTLFERLGAAPPS